MPYTSFTSSSSFFFNITLLLLVVVVIIIIIIIIMITVRPWAIFGSVNLAIFCAVSQYSLQTAASCYANVNIMFLITSKILNKKQMCQDLQISTEDLSLETSWLQLGM